ncbi:MAG: helix-turn-helix transcriptional regulator [Gammaproteobacteria bacterium]|jgi:hypothetical protein
MNLHDQLKQRRKALGLQQSDMQLRIGMNQQQYQRIEANGNPRLESLALIAQGLEAELMLIPHAKLEQVLAVLGDGELAASQTPATPPPPTDHDPWAGILGSAGR